MSNKLPKNAPQSPGAQMHVRHELTKTETSVNFSPLPPAQELEVLEQIHPGITDRILKMTEKEQDERITQKRELIELEKKHQRDINRNARLGLILAFASVLVSVGMCSLFAYLGNIEVAGDTAKYVIVSLAGVFIAGRYFAMKQPNSKH